MRTIHILGLFALALMGLAACHANAPAAKSPQVEGLSRLSEMNFVAGTGTFTGTQVATVWRDEKTGATGAYVKLPRTKLDRQLHYHTGSAHTVVLEGSVSSMEEDGTVVTLGPGDYFREAANHVHASSGSDTGAVMFMVTDGSFETRLLEEGAAKPAATPVWGAGLRRKSELQFTKGAGTFEGTQVSVLGRDEQTGATAAFVKLPPNMKLDKRMHFHTSGAHSIVLEGTVTSMTEDGRVVTLQAGDYFHEVANQVHASSGSDTGALILMITDGPFETKLAQR